MKKILVVNAGSSSMKFMIFDKESMKPISEGIAERINVDGRFKIEFGDIEKEFEVTMNNHKDASKILVEQLKELNVIKEFDEIVGIGHRVVQGGEIFKKSALINDKEIDQIEELSKLAPLHNPGAVAVMRAFKQIVPNAKNVAVFDTSFHQSMPKINYIFPVPLEWYKKYSVRRYGAHGTSHKYIAQEAKKILGKEDISIISLHLGNGASLAAIRGDKVINTSMGLTPLGGILMGTRSGDLDPSIIEYMVNESGKTVHEITKELNGSSGVKGLSNVSSDFRDLEEEAKKGNEDAIFAIEKYSKTVAEFIVKYQNDLDNKVDALIFTAGIGENAINVRAKIIEYVKTMNIDFDKEANNTRTKESHMKLTKDSSEVAVYMVKTNEELMIAKDLISVAKL
ncbi:MAG: acetate kinase [Mycoplasmatales bacterium]|nr:acetate kinase [Mycoplasmatales bacterium]